MMDVKRRYVIPGDVIATGPMKPEQNVVQAEIGRAHV